METVQVLIQRIEELLNEVEVYLETKDQLFLEVDQLDAKYQNGHNRKRANFSGINSVI